MKVVPAVPAVLTTSIDMTRRAERYSLEQNHQELFNALRALHEKAISKGRSWKERILSESPYEWPEAVKSPKVHFENDPKGYAEYKRLHLSLTLRVILDKLYFDNTEKVSEIPEGSFQPHLPEGDQTGKVITQFAKRYDGFSQWDAETREWSGTNHTKAAVVNMKVGKWLRLTAKRNPAEFPNVLDDTLRDIAEMLIESLNIGNMKTTVHKGADLARMYHSFEGENSSVNGMRMGSCMTWKGAVDLYEDNPENVSLLFNTGGARGLLWTLDDGTVFLDRVYPDNGTGRRALTNYAKNELGAQTMGDITDAHRDRGGKSRSDILKVTLDMPSSMRVPYMDTLNEGELLDGGKILIGYSLGMYATSLDSERADPFGEAEGSEYCERCGEYHNEDEGEYIDAACGFVCHYCRDNEMTYCSDCYEYHFNDDVHYLDRYNEAVCNSCLSRNYTQCPDCEEYILDDEVNSGTGRCDDCTVEHYSECQTCGGMYLNEELSSDQENCESCFEQLAEDKLEEDNANA